MKIKELIEKLQEFDPEMEVKMHNYEWGAEEIDSIITSEDYSRVYDKEFENFVILQ